MKRRIVQQNQDGEKRKRKSDMRRIKFEDSYCLFQNKVNNLREFLPFCLNCYNHKEAHHNLQYHREKWIKHAHTMKWNSFNEGCYCVNFNQIVSLYEKKKLRTAWL